MQVTFLLLLGFRFLLARIQFPTSQQWENSCPELNVVKLLEGVPSYCDVNIAHVLAKGEEIAHFLPGAEYPWPTTINANPPYRRARTPRGFCNNIDISRNRVSPGCRIAVMITTGVGRSDEAFFKSIMNLYDEITTKKYMFKISYYITVHINPSPLSPVAIFYTIPEALPRVKEFFYELQTGELQGKSGRQLNRLKVVFVKNEIATAVTSKFDGSTSICVQIIVPSSPAIRARMECRGQGNQYNLLKAVEKMSPRNAIWGMDFSGINVPVQPMPTGVRHQGFNPFDRRSDRDIRLHLFYQLLFQGGAENISVTNWGRGNVKEATIESVVKARGDDYDKLVIYIRHIGTQFLTCYEEKFITFQFYLSPFQTDQWIGILLSIGMVVSTLSIYKKCCFEIEDSISFAAWVLILGTLFDEFASVPRKMEGKTFYRLVFGCWALIAIILTNCYTGVMITELNAPLPGIQPSKWLDFACGNRTIPTGDIIKWAEVENILEYWGQIEKYEKGAIPELTNLYESEDCFRLISPPIRDDRLYFNESGTLVPPTYMFSFLFDACTAFILAQDSWMEKFHDSISSSFPEILLLRPVHSHRNASRFPRWARNATNATIMAGMRVANERELVKCEKSVYIAESDDITTELSLFSEKYAWKKKRFVSGKDLLGPEWRTWSFERAGRNKIPQYFKFMLTSGIFNRLEVEITARMVIGRQPVLRSPKDHWLRGIDPQAVNSGLITLFILCGGVVLAASLSFLVEFRWQIIVLVQEMVKVCQNLINRTKRRLRRRVRRNRRRKTTKRTMWINTTP